ncbi:MAG: hypothetical protein K0S33_1495 [Bacteroidetes bacterium]|jgi:hypothetical protein|nr:hypothetical protein [Bacteroidota bacterium]
MKVLSGSFRLIPYVFTSLCILFIPFSFRIFPFQAEITKTVFGGLLSVLAGSSKNNDVSSDSGSMYWLVLVLLVLSVLLSLLLTKVSDSGKTKLIRIIRLTAFYYLALILLKYGFDKVFKGQFYLPEPNILYTPLGRLDKDILFWSSMGTSHLYNILTGMFEVLAGALLLFRRTRNLALLFSLAALLHVLCINLGFDISVKLYTCFLIFLTLLLLIPVVKPLFGLLLFQRTEQISPEKPFFHKSFFVYVSMKTFIIGLFLLESLFPYLQAGTFNDDTAPRPYLHGAYETTEAYRNDTLIPVHLSPAKRFFIHRHNYIIFQKQDDSMQDFNILTDSLHSILYLTDYDLKTYPVPFEYSASDSTLSIHYVHDSKQYILKGKALNWRKLPALKDELHRRADE